MTIGEKIRKRRQELGMTTEELGQKIGVQRSAITKYEKDRVDLKSAQIQKIAKALDRKRIPFRKRIASADQHLAVYVHRFLGARINSAILRKYYIKQG